MYSGDAQGLYWAIELGNVTYELQERTHKRYYLSPEDTRKARKAQMRQAIMHRFREEMSREELDELRKNMESSITISAMEIQEEKY